MISFEWNDDSSVFDDDNFEHLSPFDYHPFGTQLVVATKAYTILTQVFVQPPQRRQNAFYPPTLPVFLCIHGLTKALKPGCVSIYIDFAYVANDKMGLSITSFPKRLLNSRAKKAKSQVSESREDRL